MLYHLIGYFVVSVQILVSALIVYLAVKTLLTKLGLIKEPPTLEQIIAKIAACKTTAEVNKIVNKFLK